MILFAIIRGHMGFWVEIESREARMDRSRPVKMLW